MRIISFLLKLIIAIVVVVVLLQVEYKGRKLKTYVVEYIKSLEAKDEFIQKAKEVKEQVSDKAKEIKTSKQVKKRTDGTDIPEEDREQLQNFLEKNQ